MDKKFENFLEEYSDTNTFMDRLMKYKLYVSKFCNSLDTDDMGRKINVCSNCRIFDIYNGLNTNHYYIHSDFLKKPTAHEAELFDEALYNMLIKLPNIIYPYHKLYLSYIGHYLYKDDKELPNKYDLYKALSGKISYISIISNFLMINEKPQSYHKIFINREIEKGSEDAVYNALKNCISKTAVKDEGLDQAISYINNAKDLVYNYHSNPELIICVDSDNIPNITPLLCYKKEIIDIYNKSIDELDKEYKPIYDISELVPEWFSDEVKR